MIDAELEAIEARLQGAPPAWRDTTQEAADVRVLVTEVRRLQRIEQEARRVVSNWREFGEDKTGPLVDALGDLLGKDCPDEDCPVPGCEDWGACSDCGWSGHGQHACQGRPE